MKKTLDVRIKGKGGGEKSRKLAKEGDGKDGEGRYKIDWDEWMGKEGCGRKDKISWLIAGSE